MPALATRPATTGQQLSKMDAVRNALKDLGRNATNNEVLEHLKTNWNITISPATLTNYLSTIRGNGGNGGGARARRGNGRAAGRNGGNGHGHMPGGAITPQELAATKELLDKIRPEAAKVIVNTLVD